MDERYSGYGWDDDDFCRRAREAGIKTLVAPAYVHHTATTTFKADTDKAKLIKINRKLYEERTNHGPLRD
jgi:GT2 family glycosyltransferase